MTDKPGSSTKTLMFIWGFILVSSLIWSYTQVDLNLTLFSWPPYLGIQEKLTYIGYYARTWSGVWFGINISAFWGAYIYALRRPRLYKGLLWLVVILLPAYPALSHDIFNYIFDGRIVTHYHLDPHFFKALDFPLDPWVRFMHWTHRYYPYGPVWLWLSLIPSFLGGGKFVLTLLLFKSLNWLSYLLNIFLIRKIGEDRPFEDRRSAVIYYALNPLVIWETLVSAHNETWMLTFFLAAVFFWERRAYLPVSISLLLSVGVKYLTAVCLPAFIFVRKFNRLILVCFWLWFISVGGLMLMREPYPWYLITGIGLAALLPGGNKIRTGMIFLSFALMWRYLPWLVTGDYSALTRNWISSITGLGIIGAGAVWLVFRRLLMAKRK